MKDQKLTYEQGIAKVFFDTATDMMNAKVKKLELENKKLKDKLRLNSVSQQRELLLAFTEHVNRQLSIEDEFTDEWVEEFLSK